MGKAILVAILILAGALAWKATAQDRLSGTLTMGLGDVAAIKQKAEAGDAASQVQLGNALASRFHAIEALDWYRKAATQGNVEGEYLLGQMLLFGSVGIPQAQTVKPNPAEGLLWTFQAATNYHGQACWNMSKATRQGLGTGTSLVEAYAWLELFAGTSSGSIVGRVEMNELALKMDTPALQQAHALAAQFKAGKWRLPVTQKLPDGNSALRLGGITTGPKGSLVTINGKTLAEGESATIPLKTADLTIKCLRIQKDSALIAVEGETAPRELRLK